MMSGAKRSTKKKHGFGYTPSENEETKVFPNTYPTPEFISEKNKEHKKFKYNPVERVTRTTCCTHCNKLGHNKATCPNKNKKWIIKGKINDTNPSGPKRTWVPKT